MSPKKWCLNFANSCYSQISSAFVTTELLAKPPKSPGGPKVTKFGMNLQRGLIHLSRHSPPWMFIMYRIHVCFFSFIPSCVGSMIFAVLASWLWLRNPRTLTNTTLFSHKVPIWGCICWASGFKTVHSVLSLVQKGFCTIWLSKFLLSSTQSIREPNLIRNSTVGQRITIGLVFFCLSHPLLGHDQWTGEHIKHSWSQKIPCQSGEEFVAEVY